MKTLCCIVILLAITATTAHAQSSSSTPTTDKPNATTTSPSPSSPSDSANRGEPVAPYDDKLLRLSEILGAIHYLRTLCGAKEENKWRDTMSAILKAEEPGPKRRARLVANFNRGYRTFSGSYGTCTASAILATERYMTEGALLSKQITNRYGR